MKIMSSLRAFGRDQSGASLAEYAILLAIMAAVGLTLLPGLRDAIATKFTAATTQLNGN
jgi:Flp pilus assembly pilin Flp